jgi:glycosyltransferase involved in cell wall biosynthesis
VENPGRVPIEAMAVGAPVIAADVPTWRESCGEAAVFYPIGDHRCLADLMRELMDPKIRQAARERGYRHLAGLDWLIASRKILQALGAL